MNDLANNGYYIMRNFVPDNLKTDMNISFNFIIYLDQLPIPRFP